MYLSGIFSRDPAMRKEEIHKTGFWRDGQVYKVDVATGVAEPFFALPEDKVISSLKDRGTSPIGHVSANEYSAFHGVAVDSESNVFVCDRQNQRIVVLSQEGKILREISLANPDAIAVNPKSKAIYVTTRLGNYHKKGSLDLVKFNDWSKDTAPSIVTPLCIYGMYPHPPI
jgi:DNA-binding beta-propeller fold protein YncE